MLGRHNLNWLPAQSVLRWHQVDSRVLASSVDFEIEFEAVALSNTGQARAFHGADVNESIVLAVIARDKAKPLHGVEEFDSADGLLTRQFALRAAWCGLHFYNVANNLEIRRRNLPAAIDEIELQFLTFGKPIKTRTFDLADVHEYVFAALIPLNEANASPSPSRTVCRDRASFPYFRDVC